MSTTSTSLQLCEDRVARGAAWLTGKFGPDWIWQIDLDALSISSGCRCVLGQKYLGDYGSDLLIDRNDAYRQALLTWQVDTVEDAEGSDTFKWAIAHGFNYGSAESAYLLTETWRDTIGKLRANA